MSSDPEDEEEKKDGKENEDELSEEEFMELEDSSCRQ